MRSLQFVVALTFLLIAAHTSIAEESSWPPDVQSAIERAEACEHFRGEEPYDQERRRFLELRILQSCSGINEQLRATRELHSKNAEILKKLGEFEEVHLDR